VSVRGSTVARVRVLGIDPGTRVVGYGLVDVLEAGRVVYVECGVLRADLAQTSFVRVHELARGLLEVIEELGPHEAAIEGAFHGVNAASALKLAEARGALREVCMQSRLRVHEYAPAVIKRMVAGRGRATKADVQARVALLCGLRRRPGPDAADGLAVAICHASGRLRAGTRERRERA
jgi:crossover junction endodeoxyribonuclease RuvC